MAATSPAASLCVEVERSQSSVERGQTAKWIVSVWAENGTVSGATVRLSADPAKLSPTFGFGCAHNGTASCSLGSVDSGSATRQLQTTISIPASASSVTSARLTATVEATDLLKDPTASVSVQVTAAASHSKTTPSATPTPTSSATAPATVLPTDPTSPLAVGSLPDLSTTGSKLSPGGNASGLFPALDPSSSQASPGSAGQQKTDARQVADVSAPPLGAPVADAQLAGLGALAVGFVLAVTRLSVRKRPAGPKPPAK
jgi:hypothetical protein